MIPNSKNVNNTADKRPKRRGMDTRRCRNSVIALSQSEKRTPMKNSNRIGAMLYRKYSTSSVAIVATGTAKDLVLSSQFSVLSSQFSVLSSQFSVLSAQRQL